MASWFDVAPRRRDGDLGAAAQRERRSVIVNWWSPADSRQTIPQSPEIMIRRDECPAAAQRQGCQMGGAMSDLLQISGEALVDGQRGSHAGIIMCHVCGQRSTYRSVIEEARQLLGFKSKTDTIVVALQELIRRKRIDDLKAMMGHVKVEIDLAKSRRRSRS